MSRLPQRITAKSATSLRPKLETSEATVALPMLPALYAMAMFLETEQKSNGKVCVLNPWPMIGAALKIARFLQRISQEQMAEKLSARLGQQCPQSYVSKVENAHTTLSPERLTVFCECLGWPVVSVIAVAEFLVRNHEKDEPALLRELQDLLAARLGSSDTQPCSPDADPIIVPVSIH